MSDTVFALGYDLRAVRNPAKEVTRVLLRQPDDELYSVDYLLWASLWTTLLDDAPKPEFLGPTQNLWAKLSVLRQYAASAMAGRACEASMFVAIEVLVPSDETALDMDLWQGRSELIESLPETTRTLIGYDVADVYLGSWLDADVDPAVVWSATFREREGIARSGLLIDEASAQTLADALQEVSRRDWYVYRIWRVGQP
jgi:hypothetical protein